MPAPENTENSNSTLTMPSIFRADSTEAIIQQISPKNRRDGPNSENGDENADKVSHSVSSTTLDSPALIEDVGVEMHAMSEVDLGDGEDVQHEEVKNDAANGAREDLEYVVNVVEDAVPEGNQDGKQVVDRPEEVQQGIQEEIVQDKATEIPPDIDSKIPDPTPEPEQESTKSLPEEHTEDAPPNDTAALNKLTIAPPSLVISPPNDALATPDSSVQVEAETPMPTNNTSAPPQPPSTKITTRHPMEPPPQIITTPAAPSPAAHQETPANRNTTNGTNHTTSVAFNAAQPAGVQQQHKSPPQQRTETKSKSPTRSSSITAPGTQQSNRSSSIFAAAFRGSTQYQRAMSVNHGSSHRLSQQISPLTPAGLPPPLSPINPPLHNIPSPSNSSSHESNRQRVVLRSSTSEGIVPPFHAHSSFTNLPLLKTICVPFNIAVPSLDALTTYMDPLYFTTEPSLHVLNCIHNSPQFVIGFTVEQTAKQDVQKFDQIVKIIKGRFPFVIPCFIIIGKPGSRFTHEGYIANAPVDSLPECCRTITENIIVKFKTLANKVITAPEKYMQQPITTHEQRTFESTAKQMRADYIMLTGHFDYAHDEFEQALDMCKSNNDWITIAASHEGIAACLWHEWRRRNTGGNPPEQKLIQRIVKAYTSFLSTIEKRNELRLYHTESVLRLAQFYADIRHWYPQYTVDALQLLNDAVREASIQSVQTKITVHGIAALICQQMGCMRKYGFFLRQVAQFHHELAHKQYLAVRYAAKSFECYDIPLKSNIYDETRPLHTLLRPAFEATQTYVTRGWNAVQRDCVKEVIQFAAAQMPPDILTEVQLSFFLLSCLYSVLPQNEQFQIFNRVCNLSAFVPSNQPLCVVPLPFVREIIPNALHKHQIPEEDASAKVQASQSRKIFEYTTIDLDSDDKKITKVNWVQGDAASITVALHNPLMIHLQFKSVTIETDLPCTVYPAAATLAPQSSTTLKIRIIPHEPCEQFTINNVLITFAHNSKFPRPIAIPAKFSEDIQVSILSSMPSLSIELPDKVIEIYEGEKNTALLTFTNMGSVPIDRMNWSVLPPNDAPKDLVKLHMPSQFIAAGDLQKMELFVDGTSFLEDPTYHKMHIGKPQEYSMFLEYKCHAENPLWLRRLTFKFSILVKECVTLDACVSINQQNGRQLVGRVSNFAPEPIILLSAKMAKKLEPHTKSEEEEYHHLQHYHTTGVTIGPSQTKLVLLKYHIDHEDIEHVPYSVKNAHAYHKYFAQKLRWQSTASNTSGIVALRATYSGLNMDAREEDLALDVDNEIELRNALPQEFLQVTMQYKPALADDDAQPVTQRAVHEENVGHEHERGSAQSSPVMVLLGSVVTVDAHVQSSLLRDHPQRVCQMSVWREGVNGLSHAGPRHYMHSGSHQLHLDAEQETQTHSNDMWFVAEGQYQIRVECSTIDDDNPISQPRKIFVHCVNRAQRDALRNQMKSEGK